jgi:3',5'-cyclic AMP phosphodiesterase CpdA
MRSTICRFRLLLLLAFAGTCVPAVRAVDNAFRFIVLSDTHVGKNDPLYQPCYDQAIREIVESKIRPLAVFVTGDLTDHGRESEYDHFVAWFIEPLKNAGIPLYAIPGTRDIGENPLSVWTNKIGALWQAVNVQQTRFILTCGVPEGVTGAFGFKARPDQPFGLGQGGILDSNQLAWIRRELDAPESRAAKLLVMMNHHPLWNQDFGDGEIKDTDLQGNPTAAGKTLREWMDTYSVGLFLCGSRHFQSPPIMHTFPSGRQTWHVLNESTVLGQGNKTRDAKGKPRTFNGYGYEIYDVSGATVSHYRKALDTAGFALVGPANKFDITVTKPPASTPAPTPAPEPVVPAAPTEPAPPATPAPP